MSEILEILRDLTSRQYIDRMHTDADRAINEVATAGIIDSFDEFKNIIVKLIISVNKYALKINNNIGGGREYYLNSAFKALSKKFGPNGEKAAFEMARTGKNGGLYEVLKVVAYGYIDTLNENEAQSKIGYLWQIMDNDCKFTLMDQYISEFGHLWPAEMTESSAARLKVNFPATLQLHIKNVRKLSDSMDI